MFSRGADALTTPNSDMHLLELTVDEKISDCFGYPLIVLWGCLSLSK